MSEIASYGGLSLGDDEDGGSLLMESLEQSIFLDVDAGDDPQVLYERLFNIYSSVALICALFLTFIFSVDASFIDLETEHVCEEFKEWLAVTDTKNYKFSDGDEHGCERGCNNIWKTCHNSHTVGEYYRSSCYAVTAVCVSGVLTSVRLIIAMSHCSKKTLIPFIKALGPSRHVPTVLVTLAGVLFSCVATVQSSLVMAPRQFLACCCWSSLMILATVYFLIASQHAHKAAHKNVLEDEE